MNIPTFNPIRNSAIKKLIATVFIAATAFAAFGSLGDGNKNPALSKKHTLLSGKTFSQGSFSLKSGYNYRGSQVLNANSANQYINLNTVVTLQRGNSTYIVPLKKKVILNKVKIELGNKQFKRN